MRIIIFPERLSTRLSREKRDQEMLETSAVREVILASVRAIFPEREVRVFSSVIKLPESTESPAQRPETTQESVWRFPFSTANDHEKLVY